MKPTNSFTLVATLAVSLAAAAAVSAGTVDPEAAKALQAMSDKLAAAKSLTVSGQRTDSADLAELKKASETSQVNVSLQRPNKVAGKLVKGDSERHFFFDGETVTLVELADKIYASAPLFGSIDDMVDRLEEKFGYAPPLADLLVSNTCKSLLANEPSGKVAGTEKIGDTACQHLAFAQENLEWEIWIGEDNLPRRFVIRYKDQPGKDFSVTFDGMVWDLEAKIPDGAFTFTAPEGVKKIKLLSHDELTKE